MAVTLREFKNAGKVWPFMRWRDPLLNGGLALLLALAGPFPMAQRNAAAKPFTRPEHYLMLVNGNRPNLTPNQLALFQQSPYDAMAVRFLTQYETTPPPSVEEMASTLVALRKSAGKDFWPWVFLNRMVGRDPDLDSPYARDPYFARTHGLDLQNATGAKKDFLQIWRDTLRAANRAHTPGIVADLELYVNYKAYEPALLAQQIGKTVNETLELLQGLGAQLADVAAKEYPDGRIWFLFTDLGQLGWKVEGGVKYYPTPAYIVLGLLDEIRDKHYALRVISGGEVSLEYCSFSVEHLKRKIEGRTRDFASHLEKYDGSLELAGTMILWPDRTSKTDFVAQGACGKSDAATVEDQQAYLELLFKTYRYNWIYGTHNSGYDPFNPAIAPRINAVIRKAENNAESHSALH